MRSLLAAVFAITLAAPALAQADLEIRPSNIRLSDRGVFKTAYFVVNTTGDKLAVGSQIRVIVEVPPRQKTMSVATIGCAPYDCTGPDAAKEVAGDWVCNAPYHQAPALAPGAAWTHPSTIACTMTLKSEFAPGARTRLLSVHFDGGKPRGLCAAITATPNANATNDQTCYANSAVAEYDLKLSMSPSTAPGRTNTWRSMIANIGAGAVPVERITSHPIGAAGFVYTAELPGAPVGSQTLILQELTVFGGWTCEVKAMGISPIAVPLHGKSESKILNAKVPDGGATLECVYATPFEFGAGAELASDLPSAGPVYVTRGWPAGSNSHCADIKSLNSGFVEDPGKLANNKICWPVAP